MNQKRNLVVLALLLLLVCGGYYWVQSYRSEAISQSGAAKTERGDAALGVRSGADTPELTKEVKSIIGVAPRRESFDEIKSRAQAGDLKAIRELYHRYDECYFYNASPKNIAITNLEKLAISKPQFRNEAERIKRDYHARCAYVEGGRSYPSEMVLQWMELLKERGDPVGLLSSGPIAEGKTDPATREQLKRILERMQREKDPEAVFMVSFSAARDPNELELPDSLHPLFGNWLAPVAWQIAACRGGYDSGCGRGSRTMNINCGWIGFCQYDNLEAKLLDMQVPPGRRQDVFEMVGQIQARFL